MRAHSASSCSRYGLPWGSPGWINDQRGYYGPDQITYQVNWLKCARDHHGIDVDWLGLWNERPWGTPEYVKDLKKAMVAEGLATKLVLGDIPVSAAVLLSRLHKTVPVASTSTKLTPNSQLPPAVERAARAGLPERHGVHAGVRRHRDPLPLHGRQREGAGQRTAGGGEEAVGVGGLVVRSRVGRRCLLGQALQCAPNPHDPTAPQPALATI